MTLDVFNLNSLSIMNITITNKILIIKLREIVNSNSNTIKTFVAKEALAYHRRDIKTFFVKLYHNDPILSELLCEGASDEFFDTYYLQIKKLKDDYEITNDQSLIMKGNSKDDLSWFAYRQTALRLAKELGFKT